MSSGAIASNSTGATPTLSANTTVAFPASQEGIVSVVSGASAFTIAGPITTSTAGLTETGAGSLVLSATNNSYSGDININAGTISISASVLPASSGTIIFNGGTLAVTANTTVSNAITLNSGGGNFNITSNATLSSIISGSGGLTLVSTSTGTLALTAADNYTGTTSISSGTLDLTGASGTANQTAFTVNQGGTLMLDNTGVSTIPDRIGDSANITLAGGGLTLIGSGSTATNESFGQLILSPGASTITVIGAAGGATTLTSTYTGPNPIINRSAGATVLFRGSNFGSTPGAGAGNVLFSALAGASIGTVATALNEVGNGTLGGGVLNQVTAPILPYALGDTTASGTGSNFVTYDNTGSNPGVHLLNSNETASDYTTANTNVRLTSGPADPTNQTINSLFYAGATTGGTGNVLVTIASGAFAVSTSTGNSIGSGNATFAFGTQEGIISAVNGATITISGNITGSGGIAMNGGGSLVLSGVNSYSGGTNIDAGMISINANNTLRVGNNTISFYGGTLAVTANTTVSNAITLNSGGGNFNITSNTTLSSIISGSGGLTLVSTSTGTLVLTGANSYSGGTNINAGTISVNANGTLPAANNTISFNGGTLAVTANTTVGNAITLNSGGGTLSVVATQSLTLLGVISGAGNLTVAGSNAGTIILANTETYTGATTINAGTLDLNGGSGTANLTPISVNGGTLLLDNSTTTSGSSNNNNRISGTLPLTLAGGTLALNGNDGANTTEVMGPLILASGNSVITIAPNRQERVRWSAALSPETMGLPCSFPGPTLARLCHASHGQCRQYDVHDQSITGNTSATPGWATSPASIMPYALGDRRLAGRGTAS